VVPRQAILSRELFAKFKNPPSLPERLYELGIAPATTYYFPPPGEDLANFQPLAGDPPTLTRAGWTWTGVSNVTVLAQDIVAADAAQQQLFWSGILLGVAGAGAFAIPLELLSLGEKRSRRKRTEKATQQVSSTDEPGHQKRSDDLGNSNETPAAASPRLPPSQ
jgi:hypothetical protein